MCAQKLTSSQLNLGDGTKKQENNEKDQKKQIQICSLYSTSLWVRITNNVSRCSTCDHKVLSATSVLIHKYNKSSCLYQATELYCPLVSTHFTSCKGQEVELAWENSHVMSFILGQSSMIWNGVQNDESLGRHFIEVEMEPGSMSHLTQNRSFWRCSSQPLY